MNIRRYIFICVTVLFLLTVSSISTAFAADGQICFNEENTCSDLTEDELVADYTTFELGENTYKVVIDMQAGQFNHTQYTVEYSLNDKTNSISIQPGESKIRAIEKEYSLGTHTPELTMRFNNSLISRDLPSFTVVNITDTNTTGNITENTTEQERNFYTHDANFSTAQVNLVVQESGVQYVVERDVTKPTRFKDGDGMQEVLEDQEIPPFNPSGDLRKFSNIRVRNEKPAIIEDSPGTDNTRVGFATYNIPRGNNMSLVVRYSFSSTDATERARVKLVDAGGNVISDTYPGDRTLERTTGTSFDDSRASGLTPANTLSHRESFELTPLERSYINTNNRIFVIVEAEDGTSMALFKFDFVVTREAE